MTSTCHFNAEIWDNAAFLCPVLLTISKISTMMCVFKKIVKTCFLKKNVKTRENFRIYVQISGPNSNFRTNFKISGQRPGLILVNGTNSTQNLCPCKADVCMPRAGHGPNWSKERQMKNPPFSTLHKRHILTLAVIPHNKQLSFIWYNKLILSRILKNGNKNPTGVKTGKWAGAGFSVGKWAKLGQKVNGSDQGKYFKNMHPPDAKSLRTQRKNIIRNTNINRRKYLQVQNNEQSTESEFAKRKNMGAAAGL